MRTNFFGPFNGLSVILSPPIDTGTMLSHKDGIRLLIDDGRNHPSDTSHEKLLPVGFETFVRVTGEETTCSSEVGALAVADRDCVFEQERTLKSFPDYRERNCALECRTWKVGERCDCLSYLHPVTGPRTCNFTKIGCLTENHDYFQEFQMNSTKDEVCNCPPNCNSIRYDVRLNPVPMLHKYFKDPFL